MTPVRWLMPSTTLDAPTEAAETYGVHRAWRVGAQQQPGSFAVLPGCSAGQLPQGWPDSGFFLSKAPPRVLACLLQRRSVCWHSLPHAGECSVNQRGWWGPRAGWGEGAPGPLRESGQPQPPPQTGHPTMALAVSHPPAIFIGSPSPPGSTGLPRGLLSSPSTPNSRANLPLRWH